jgi:hypothetical protein
MSWLVVFASYMLPLPLLFILLAMDRLPRTSRQQRRLCQDSETRWG